MDPKLREIYTNFSRSPHPPSHRSRNKNMSATDRVKASQAYLNSPKGVGQKKGSAGASKSSVSCDSVYPASPEAPQSGFQWSCSSSYVQVTSVLSAKYAYAETPGFPKPLEFDDLPSMCLISFLTIRFHAFLQSLLCGQILTGWWDQKSTPPPLSCQ